MGTAKGPKYLRIRVRKRTDEHGHHGSLEAMEVLESL